MEPWFEAYRTWPPINQLAFSAAALLAGLLLIILALFAVYHMVQFMVILARGWPPTRVDPTRPKWDEIRELNRIIGLARKQNEQENLPGGLPAAPEPVYANRFGRVVPAGANGRAT